MSKKTERITLWLPEELKVELMHLAADDDRALGEFIVLALSRFTYGHSRTTRDFVDVANSGGQRQ